MVEQESLGGPRVIVFDIGNVLIETDFKRYSASLKRIFPDEEAYRRAKDRLDHYGERYGVGLMTTEEIMQEAEEKLEIDRKRFVELWNALFIERGYILPFLRELRDQGYILATCSNTNEMHVEHLLSRYSFLGLIEHHIFSYRVQVCKPEAAIYRAVEAITGRPAWEHLFLDDLPVNVAAARLAGWDAICFQNEGQVQRELRSRGLRFTPWKLE